MKCPKCNFENVEDANFCEKCGNLLRNGVSQEKSYKSDVNTKKKGFLKSFLIGIGIIFTLFILIGIFSRGSNNESVSKNDKSVTFCTSVDKDLKPTGESDNFTKGNVTVRLTSSGKFNTDKVKVTLYKIDGKSESIIDSSEEQVNPDWSVVAFPIKFTESGSYRVDFTKDGNSKIGSGTVNIK